MEQEINSLKNRVEELESFILSLKSSATIPLDVSDSFKDRILETSVTGISSKTAGSETKTVIESGSATYTVSAPMDGFIQVRVNGAIYNVPYFN